MVKREKLAAFFYIGSNGYVNIRKPGDYVSKMIELAGGDYVFTTENTGKDENALSTMNMQFESFYDIAKDADFLIYNGTVDGSLTQMSQLIAKILLWRILKRFRTEMSGVRIKICISRLRERQR